MEFCALSLYDDSSTSDSSPYYVSRAEAIFYYSGLPSSPRLVYRTGSETRPWKRPTGPEAYRVLKELRPVFGHQLNTVWKDLGPQVLKFLDSQGVWFTSIDIVRFKKVGKGEPLGPVVLWIGVTPDTLFGEAAHKAAYGCLDLLQNVGIKDVEVEIRESIYTQSAGPDLLKPVSNYNPLVDVCGPLTTALGLPIAGQKIPNSRGTGGFYLAEGGESKKVFLVTARHVLFPLNEGANVDYARTNTSAPPRNVLLLGAKDFDNFIKSIKIRIGGYGIMAPLYTEWTKELKQTEDGDDETVRQEAAMERKELLRTSEKENRAMEALHEFCAEVGKKWRNPSQRILGHVVHSPRVTLGAGDEGYTEDYAVIELDISKIEEGFKGNVIDLGTEIHFVEFKRKMYPRYDHPSTFEYPLDRLLKLQDILPEELMHNPDMLDHDGQPYLYVIKSGNATGVTIGRATGAFSYVRQHFPNGTHQTSKEWAILPYDDKSGVFSAPGDSGSLIADSCGRFGGLLTGGAGKRDSSDVTYATPIAWLLPRIKAHFPHAHLYPAMDKA